MFGASAPPQNEKTVFSPRSPYACAKVYSYWLAKNYREGYNIFTANGILFNHESPRRGETFVTRKITRAIAAILCKKQRFLYLGNLDARRDWGFAPEYVMAMWKILQQKNGDDFVIGSGKAYSVREFVQAAFFYVGLDWKKYVHCDKRYFRPTEVDCLIADARKAKKVLNWKATIGFNDLVKIMIDADMRKAGLTVIGEGDEIIKKKFNGQRWWKVD